MRGKTGIRVFMTSPFGRMSRFQQAQMFSLQDQNIFNIAIKGVFDDCQDIVKSVSNDLEFKQRFKIGTVNSINWARLLAQVVYYFAGYFQVTVANHESIDFTVPSGNFGNVCAGHVARMMGLPVRRLIVATNENDVLDEFFRTGIYKVRSSEATFETSSPSMDISKASNFERFIFDLLDRDANKTAQMFTTDLKSLGEFRLEDDRVFDLIHQKFGFSSGKSTHQNRLNTIRDVFEKHQHVIDPHTADGVFVAKSHVTPNIPMVVLETALPIKFAKTIEQAIGHSPPMPVQFQHLEHLPQKVELMSNNAQTVKDFISLHCSG
jgi:threonine synthase